MFYYKEIDIPILSWGIGHLFGGIDGHQWSAITPIDSRLVVSIDSLLTQFISHRFRVILIAFELREDRPLACPNIYGNSNQTYGLAPD